MIPCKDCLLIPICKHKYFLDLRRECSIINHYLYIYRPIGARGFEKRMQRIYHVLKPSFWEVKEDENKIPYLTYEQKTRRTI